MATPPDLTKLSPDQLRAMILAMAAAPARKQGFSMKVSEKGCLSIYGMSSRGIHLYASQWERILENAEKITAFIAENPEVRSSDGTRVSGLARKAV